MTARHLTRRRLLAASLPAAAGLAGCSGTGGSGDQGGAGGTTRDPEPDSESGTGTAASATTPAETAPTPLASFPSLTPDEPTYRDWIPGTGQQRGVFDAAYNFSRLRGAQSSLPASRYESLGTWAMGTGYVGIEYDELDGMLAGVSAPTVYLGSFTRADVADRLGGTRYEQFRSDDRVTYFRRTGSDSTALLGVGTAGVVADRAASDADSPGEAFVERARVLFETARGARPRLHEESARYAAYTDTMGWPLFVTAGLPRPLRSGGLGVGSAFPGSDRLSEEAQSSLRFGHGQYLAGGSLVERTRLRLEDGASVSPADIEERYATGDVRGQILADGQSLAVRTGSATVDIGRLTPVPSPGGGVDPVLATLAVAVDAGTATVEHVAGEDLPLDRVTLRAGDEQRPLGNGTLTAGASIDRAVPADTTRVRLIYSPPAADEKTVIARP